MRVLCDQIPQLRPTVEVGKKRVVVSDGGDPRLAAIKEDACQ